MGENSVIQEANEDAFGDPEEEKTPSPKQESQQKQETDSKQEQASNFEAEESPLPTQETPAELPIEEAGLKVFFIDVGQGDATLIEVVGQGCILVDGGYEEYADKVLTVLAQEGLDKIDYMVGTHAHADHVGSLSSIMKRITVGTLLVPQEENENFFYTDMLSTARSEGATIALAVPGDTFTLGDAKVTVYGPFDASEGVEEINDTSVVLKIEYKEISFLLSADAETNEEYDIMNSGYDLQATVLKVGHHGSSSSTGYLWLRSINPKYAVISCGIDNEYGHPTHKTLKRIKDADVTLFRTDLQGTITCWTDGYRLSWSVEHDPDIDTYDHAGSYTLY